MRNLISFINKYSFFFLFLAFEVFAFYLLFRNNNYQRVSFLNSTNTISGSFYESYSELTDYVNLKEVNEALVEENEKLRAQQINAFQRLFGENIMVKDTIFKRKFRFAKAKIINSSTNRQNNYITLNVGSSNGIKSGMGVIGPSGVVGVVKNVSENYSSVLSMLHRSAKISAKLKNTQYFGSLQWDGRDYQEGILRDIPNHVNLRVGDTVVTSGYSATFPEGITVATIQNIDKPEGENFYKIRVSFINDFKNISQVYVVKNSYKLEQKNLEKTSLNSDD